MVGPLIQTLPLETLKVSMCLSCDCFYTCCPLYCVGTNYTTANVLLMTFVVNNHVDDEKNGKAEAWEKAYLEYLKSYKSDLIEVSFIAEVCVGVWVWFNMTPVITESSGLIL